MTIDKVMSPHCEKHGPGWFFLRRGCWGAAADPLLILSSTVGVRAICESSYTST